MHGYAQGRLLAGQRLQRRAFAAPWLPARAALPASRRRGAPAVRAPLSCNCYALPDLLEKWVEPVTTLDDEVKEQSRKFRRTVFDHTAWEQHRSTSRYKRHLLGMFSSRMVMGLAPPLKNMAVVSIAVVAYESCRQAGALPDVLPWDLAWPCLLLNSREPFTLTSFALSLLLVFRTNASYARWLDARKSWGLLLNRTRDLVRQGLTWMPDEDSELKAMLCRWAPAFSRVLMCHLRKDADVGRELQGVLDPDEVEQVLLATHRPNYVLQVLSQIVKEGRAGTPATLRMEENLTAFEDVLGTCERILKTPIPLSYTRHTSRFLVLWLSVLPFTLYEGCGWLTVPLCVLIAFLLLGIEEIGVSIEEPFSILALEAICDTAHANVRELLATSAAAGGAGTAGGNQHQRRALSAAQVVQAKRSAGLAARDFGGGGSGNGGVSKLDEAAAGANASSANGDSSGGSMQLWEEYAVVLDGDSALPLNANRDGNGSSNGGGGSAANGHGHGGGGPRVAKVKLPVGAFRGAVNPQFVSEDCMTDIPIKSFHPMDGDKRERSSS